LRRSNRRDLYRLISNDHLRGTDFLAFGSVCKNLKPQIGKGVTDEILGLLNEASRQGFSIRNQRIELINVMDVKTRTHQNFDGDDV
jgi:hypothetical protein